MEVIKYEFAFSGRHILLCAECSHRHILWGDEDPIGAAALRLEGDCEGCSQLSRFQKWTIEERKYNVECLDDEFELCVTEAQILEEDAAMARAAADEARLRLQIAEWAEKKVRQHERN